MCSACFQSSRPIVAFSNFRRISASSASLPYLGSLIVVGPAQSIVPNDQGSAFIRREIGVVYHQGFTSRVRRIKIVFLVKLGQRRRRGDLLHRETNVI